MAWLNCYNDFDVITEGLEYFHETILDDELADEFYTFQKYEKAVKKYGFLEYDECFGYVPLLAMGGRESVNNIKKVKIKEHIALIVDLTGGVWWLRLLLRRLVSNNNIQQ